MKSKEGIPELLVPLLKLPILKSKQQRELSKRILKTGDLKAVDILVKHNVKLVVSIAKKFVGQTDIGLDDLIQAGICGLLKAANKFNYRKARFSTYATWWIKQVIRRAIQDEGETIRVPVYVYERWRKIKKIIREFQDEFGREPTESEIAESLGLSIRRTRKALLAMRNTPNSSTLLQLDSYVENQDGDSDCDLKEIISDLQLNPEQFIEAKDELKSALQRIEDMKNHLRDCQVSERNIKVFCDRFGLDGSFEVKTLEETGKHFAITRERVRQITVRMIWRLRKYGVENKQWFKEELNRIRFLERLIGQN